MRWKDYGIILLCLVVCGAMLYLASSQQDSIRASRKDMGLMLTTNLGDAPPSLAFATVAMGAFRGLIVDVLWMRADKLKQDGKFFDAKQLAEWISMLQPRFAAVWDFHAWNMAYNISVAIPNTQCQERWRWVRNGYELLRDKGIEYNPHSIMLYRQLSWIFLHKIGDIADDCNTYYKLELALSMRPLLGDKTNTYFEKLAAAPLSFQDILKDPQVKTFVDALRQADKAFLSDEQLIDNYLALRQNPDRFPKETFAVIDQYRQDPGLAKFDVFARAYQIRHVWKMDPAYMQQLNQMYGPTRLDDPNQREPLNWEHPAVHAIYWSAKGLDMAGREGQYRVDEKNTDRIIFHSLQMLYRSGNIILYTSKDGKTDIFMRPDMRMFASCDQTWRKVIEKYETLEKGNPKAVRGGHKNFLENAVMTFYQAGHARQALEIYRTMITQYKINDEGIEEEDFKLPMIEFLQKRMKEEFQGLGIRDAVEAITGMLRESYFRYAVHNDDEAAGLEKMAQEVHTFYQKEHADEAYRMGLPTFEMLRYTSFMDFLYDPMYPEELRLNLLGRLQVERPDLFEKLQKQDQAYFEKLRKEQESQQAPQQP